MKKKVLLKGPLLTRSGYGEQARFALRALRSREDLFEVYIQPLQWGKTSWSSEMDEERAWIDQTIEKTIAYIQQGARFDMSLQVTIPNEFQKLAPINIGYTAGIETTKIAHQWIPKANEMDKIITISKHSMDVYKNTSYEATDNSTGQKISDYRCTTEIDYVGFPVKEIEPDELDLQLRHDFNFLCVAQIGPRKNVDAVLNNFIEEFKNEDVGLLLKLNGANDSIMDFHKTKEMFSIVQKSAKEEGWKCSINLLHGNLTDEQIIFFK